MLLPQCIIWLVAKPKILNLKLVDVSTLFENDPSPSWVAATLAKITKD